MANKIVIKRTSSSGVLPNTTNSSNTSYIAPGELAINLTDQKMVSSNGSVPFEIGANLTNLFVSNGAEIDVKLQVGNHAGSGGYDFGSLALIEGDGNQNGYLQVVIQNANTGEFSTSDFIAVADDGTDTAKYADFGINGSMYNGPDFTLSAPYDAYVYSSDGHLTLGSLAAKDIIFHSAGGNTENELARFTTAGELRIGNSTVNTSITDTQIIASNLEIRDTATINTNSITIGNSSVNTIISSTVLDLGGEVQANGSAGTAGHVLKSGGSGANAYWAAATGSGTPGGVDTQVQFNDGGSTFGGDAGLTYNKTTDALTVAGSVLVGANVVANTSALLVGNSSVNAVLTQNSLDIDGTIAAGNTTLVGFINVSSTANVGGAVNLRSTLAVNGAVTVPNTAALGNTTITGFANVTSTIQGGAGLTIAGAASGITTLAAGNTTITGFANVSGTANVGGATTLRSTLVVNGAITVPNTAAFGNTTISGFANVSGAVFSAAAITGPTQLATKEYVDSAVSAGIHVHESVRLETAAAISSVTYTQGGTTPTITAITTNDTLTSVGHGLSVGDIIVFGSTTNGLTAGTAYVVESVATDTFKISATYIGAPITSLTNGTGLSITSRANAGVGAKLTNSGTQAALVIDGVTAAYLDRVSIRLQANAAQNGIYFVSNTGSVSTNWELTRTTDANKYGPTDPNNLGGGDYFYTREGDVMTGDAHVLSTEGIIVFGTTELVFNDFYKTVPYSGVAPINVSSTNISFVLPSASNTEVQFNDSATINSSAAFTFNKTSNTLTVSNTIQATNKLRVGTPGGYDFGVVALIEQDGNSNTYLQTIIQNANTGNNASSELVVTADTGNDSVNFASFGINGSNYNQAAFNIGGALDAFVYSSNSNIQIGTAANNGAIVFHANGTTSADEMARINTTGLIVSKTIQANAITIGANLSLNTSGYFVGNSTVNTTQTSSLIQVSNSTSTANLTATQLSIGANVFANTSAFDVGNTIITSALLTLGGQVNANGGVGTAGQVLKSGATGNVYWDDATGGGTPGGVNTYIQYNDSSVFGGKSTFTFNESNDTMTVGNTINAGNVSVTNTITTANLSVSGVFTLATDSIQVGNSTVNTAITNTDFTKNGVSVVPFGQQTIWVPAIAMVPQTTTGAASGTVEAATNRQMLRSFDFDTTTQEFVQFAVQMPKSWDLGTIVAQFVWSHAATTTNFGVVWAIDGYAYSDNIGVDQTWGTEQLIADTGGTTNNIYLSGETPAVTIGGTPGAEEYVIFRVKRVPANGSDTMAIDARLHGVKIHYTTNAASDT